MMDIVAWKQTKTDDNMIRCMLQVNYRDGRRIKTVLKQLDDWTHSGQGYSPLDKNEILILLKDFKSDYLWKKFLKQFPFRIVEKSVKTKKERVYNADKII